MQVLDHGYVELEQAIGGDHSVVAAARRSRHVRWKDAAKGPEADARFISRLMRKRHGTPFEHNLFTFAVSAPLFVFREWHRHRIASYNELSGRYAKLERIYYIPEHKRIPDPEDKQSSIIVHPFSDIDAHRECIEMRDLMIAQTECALDEYEQQLSMGVARELSRLVLPLNLYSEMVYTTNARSLMNFLSLRNEPGAQWEIQEFARAMEMMFEQEMPMTYEAFVQHGRIAP